MNKKYIDQILSYIKASRLDYEDDDVAAANAAMAWFVDTLDKQLGNCHGVEDGRCQFYWKHDDCVRLMAILKDLTGNQKYSIKINQPTLWD